MPYKRFHPGRHCTLNFCALNILDKQWVSLCSHMSSVPKEISQEKEIQVVNSEIRPLGSDYSLRLFPIIQTQT